ncbi:hypothetical protein BXY66_1200 [Shimia isoporae]|uniref:Uncharacterized protein n=1 Tax=Shimia isoporae TaxID=647720 RepID=A0A4R1NM01_9RHOB|nr:hypothetical protein [Shimia isoporae]TCL09155.1 hypothetical protein BXY66_1200 [Shimia isoporae]
MKAQDFLDWMEKADARYAADIVRHLDCGRNRAQAMKNAAEEGEDVPVNRTTALAMSAIAAGLPAWGEKGDFDE